MSNLPHLVQTIAIWAIPVLFAITVHEVAHGWMASKLGDKTAFIMGRLTLNPLKHIDPMGTIIVPVLLLIFSTTFGGSPIIFGWAKPVPVSYANLNNPKRDMALVAVAGPASNLLMAIFWAIIVKLAYIFAAFTSISQIFILMGQAGILINLVLMILNLVPIPPLDGSRILAGLLPRNMVRKYYRLEPYGFIILLVLLVSGILGRIIFPLVVGMFHLIIKVFGL
jgi:Zn-dependent protease